MALRPEEVSSIIQQEISKYKVQLEMKSVGTILQIGDGIARIYGLEDAMAGELLEFPGGVKGMVLNLEETMSALPFLVIHTTSRKATLLKEPKK